MSSPRLLTALMLSAPLCAGLDFPALFGEGEPLGEGGYASEAFGQFSTPLGPWVEHSELGWLYVPDLPDGMRGGWVHHPRMEWLWFHPDLTPHFYRAASESWQHRAPKPARSWYYDHFLADWWRPGNHPDAFYIIALKTLDEAEATVAAALPRLTSTSQYPEYTSADGGWTTREASWWTSGFWPGLSWQIYEHNPSAQWLIRARQWSAGLTTQQFNTTTHDIGFMLFCSFGQGYRLTGDANYRQVLVNGANSLNTRYSPTVGGTRSWSWGSWHGNNRFTIIVDNMMNLELLFRAATMDGGDSAWYDHALQHARTTIAEHMRPDGGSYHAVVFDERDGRVLEKRTYQGYSDSSTWSRGQAWLIYGLVLTYRETGEADILEATRRAVDYFLTRLPEDLVPYWDFQAPGIPETSRDTTAAAITASALMELSLLAEDESESADYLAWAVAITRSLRDNYRDHDHAAILDEGTIFYLNNLRDTGVVYGDYYFVEVLLRYVSLIETGTLPYHP